MDVIREYWHIIGSAFGAVFWFARLESRVNQNGRDMQRLEKHLSEQRKEDMETHKESMGRIERALSGLESDIKELVRRVK